MNIPSKPATRALTLFDLWNYKLFPQGSIFKACEAFILSQQRNCDGDRWKSPSRSRLVGVSAGGGSWTEKLHVDEMCYRRSFNYQVAW